MEEDQLILVDEKDVQIGVMGKSETHRQGLLHRAFSIFILNDKGELMLQKRALNKYHSGGLWTNTCCGHPRNGEGLIRAVHRRLLEEMGFDCVLREIFSFQYEVRFDSGLHENEIDHVFIGGYSGAPVPDPSEADDWKWLAVDNLESEILMHPMTYTHWFKEGLKEMKKRNINFRDSYKYSLGTNL